VKLSWRATLLVLIAVAAAFFLASRFRPRPIAAELLRDESIAVDGVVRRFRLVIPHATAQGPVPLVIAFHGMGDSSESMAAYSKLDGLAAEKGFLLVYPAAARSMWGTVNVDLESLDEHADVRFFDELLVELGTRFELDHNRIYVIGMSNGASFAQLLASARRNVVAVVAHSGAPPREVFRPSHSFPVLLLVGEDDPAFDAMLNGAADYRERGHPAEFTSVPGLGHEWSTSHNSTIWDFLSAQKRDR